MENFSRSNSQLNNISNSNNKLKISLDINDTNYLYNKLKYKEPIFFSYSHLDRNIKNLKKDNLRKFKFINNHLEIELNKKSKSEPFKNNITINTTSTFNNKKEDNNRLKPIGGVSALTDEEIVFNRIYDRHLNNLMQIKDFNMPKNTVIKTKDQIKKSMINFFSRGEVNSKIISIKNKIFLMKGVVDYSLPIISNSLKNDEKSENLKLKKSNDVEKKIKRKKVKKEDDNENYPKIKNISLDLNNENKRSIEDNGSGYIEIKNISKRNKTINEDSLQNEIDQTFKRNEYNYHTIEENDSELND